MADSTWQKVLQYFTTNHSSGGNAIKVVADLSSTSSSGLATSVKQDTTNTEIGIVTETSPATDTASSGLNGRLQRIAQRLTSLIALFPTSLGQGTMATSMKVVLPSDQSAIPVTLPSGTETPSSSVVTGSGASPVAAGKVSVTFTTDSSFVGTILGVARNSSTTYSFSVSNPGKTLSTIAYTVTSGSMIIDVIS